jgi:hypothetical protein
MAKKGASLLDGFTMRNPSSYTGVSAPPCVTKAIEYLEKLPYKELISTRDLSSAIRSSYGYFSREAPNAHLKPYCVKMRPSVVLWGSKRTIKELQRQMEKQ